MYLADFDINLYFLIPHGHIHCTSGSHIQPNQQICIIHPECQGVKYYHTYQGSVQTFLNQIL